jgi:hypothetical protein
VSDTSWRIAALNGIRRALGGTAQQFDIEKIPLEQLQRTKLEPYLAASAGADEPFAGGYYRDAWQLQRGEFVETLQDLNAAGIVPTTFKGCELFERYSNGGSFGLMTDVDIIVSKDELIETMSVLYRRGMKPGSIDYETGRFQPLKIEEIGAVEMQHFQLPPFLVMKEVKLMPASFKFARAHGRRPLKVFGERCYLIFEIDVHNRTAFDVPFEMFTAHRCDSVFKNARTLSPTDHLWSITARYYNEVALHKKTSLREFIYIAMIVRNEDVDWDRFLELTHEFGTYAACYYPLAFLHSIEPSRVPEAALSKLRPVEGRRGRDYGWQLGKLFDFIEPLPFRPEAQEFPSQ